MQIEKDLDLEKNIDMARQSGDQKAAKHTRNGASGLKQIDVGSVDRVFEGRQ